MCSKMGINLTFEDEDGSLYFKSSVGERIVSHDEGELCKSKPCRVLQSLQPNLVVLYSDGSERQSWPFSSFLPLSHLTEDCG